MENNKTMAARINNINEEAPFWFEQAITFYESSKILEDSPSEHKIFPIITLQSFSVECSLKYFSLCSTGKYRNIHDLYLLFNDLSECIKDDISSKYYSLHDADFKQNIIEISKDFVESRYYFDQFKKLYFGKGFSNGYLNTIAGFLIEYGQSNKNINFSVEC